MARCAWPPPLKVGECGAGRIDRRRLAHDLAFLTTFLNTNYVLSYSVQALHRMKRPIGNYGALLKLFRAVLSLFLVACLRLADFD